MTRRALLLLVLATAVVSTWNVSHAEETPPKFVGLRVGFEGRYRVGQWTPVEVTLRGGSRQLSGSVTLTVPDGDGVPSWVMTAPEKPVLVLPGRDTPVSLYVRFGRIDCELTARFHVGDKVIAREEFLTSYEPEENRFRPAIPSRQRLIVVVGPAAVGARDAVALLREEPKEKTEVVRLGSVDHLPTRWYGYEGVDALILATSRPEIYRKLALGGARVEALERWIRMGGQVVFSVGARADEILDEQSPLSRFAPGRLANMIPLPPTGALETYCKSARPVPDRVGGKSGMLVPQLADVQGVVEAREGDLPLIVRTARSFGQVVFIAADLDQPPLAKWKGRGLLVAKLLGLEPASEEGSPEATAVMHYGYNDIAGQLRSALDRFTDVRMVPFWLVVGLILLYVLLIGPGDYLFVRKVLRRPEATWVTFPLIVLAVGVGAYVLAYRLKGDQIRLNQVDLVDVDASSQLVRGTTWVNVFSPRMESYDLSFRAKLPSGSAASNARLTTAWFGLPGSGLGGMNPHTSNPTLWRRSYAFSPDLASMSGVPIQVWSTKSITGRWSAAAERCPKAELVQTELSVTGTITNTLDFALRDCRLLCGQWAYELGTIDPEETVEIGPALNRMELKTLLTGRRLVPDESGDKYQHETTPYDESSTDTAHILRMMMFFKAGGGSNYAGLANRYQGFVDMSDLLEIDRAVLLAEAETASGSPPHAGSELLRDGMPLADAADKHVTFYRFVFPVKTEETTQ